MKYEEQLQDQRWKLKREEIIKRDKERCTKCNLERLKIRGIRRFPGILNYAEFSEFGRYSVDFKNNRISYLFYPGLTVFGDSERVVLGDISSAKIEDIKFAEQLLDGEYRLICFTDDITDKDLRPDLHVHHKYYVKGKKAWEYDNTALVTLCTDCHQEEHSKNVIKVFSEMNDELYEADTCGKCFGSGYLKQYDYYCDGICFECQGEGVILHG